MADEQTPPQDDLEPGADGVPADGSAEEPSTPATGDAATPGAADPDAPSDEPLDQADASDGASNEDPDGGDESTLTAAGDASAGGTGGFDLPGIDDDEIDADEAAAAAAASAGPGESADPAPAPPAGTAAPPSPAPPPPASGVSPDALAPVLGAAATPIARFGARVAEVLQVGVESVGGRGASVSVTRADVADYAALEEEFAEIPHLGLEVKFAFSEVDSAGLCALVPLPDVGRLLGLETDPGALSDPEFRSGQLETIATASRELLDLMSLALFTDELAGAEATLADLRFDDAGTTLAHAADAGERSTPVRIELQLALDGERSPVGCTVVIPTALLARLAEVLAPGVALPDAPQDFGDPLKEPPPEPTPLRRRSASGSPRVDTYGAPPPEPGFGLDYDLGNISPIRGSATRGRADDDVEVHPVRFPPLDDNAGTARAQRSLDLIMDVQMRVAVELGRSSMSVEDILALGPGSVVELNKLAGEPVDILVNDHLIARGEVVVVDENFGVRVTEIVSANRRARAMGR